jgi:hypothetical protein
MTHYLRVLGILMVAFRLGAAVPTFRVMSDDAKPWNAIFASIGISASGGNEATVTVTGPNAQTSLAHLANNGILVLQGDSPLARQLGVIPGTETVSVRRIIDTHAPEMPIIWAESPAIPVSTVPEDFQVFARERWKNAPLMAGMRTGQGAVLWLATDPGPEGTERYPYLLQALSDLGLPLPVRSVNLWAFFDSAYRSRADMDYLARRWRKAGVSALHVAAWHNMEIDAERDDYLKNLIAACHRHAILVYAWFELPHVSEEFWNKHPQWREKTAVGEDAQLDWRKLMNLQNERCRTAVAQSVREMLKRFDWDGVNLAELYFESLEGASNPARFTPMNEDIRRQFQEQSGWDPRLLFDPASPHSGQHDPAGLRRFLDFRARLASRMQADWLDVVDQLRPEKPWLDVVLTHIDDRLEPGMHDALGADSARSAPYLQAEHATVLVEDPATLWNLGASRYAKLAEKWAALPLAQDKVAVDINVVERYQDVYPTKKQTGTELFALVHQAASSFSRVALYFENSLEPQDLTLLPAAAAASVRLTETAPDELSVDSPQPVRVGWSGAAELDGKPWPLGAGGSVLVPAGNHKLTAGVNHPPVTIADFNGSVRNAIAEGDTVELSYRNNTRAIMTLGSPVSALEVDGASYWKPAAAGQPQGAVLLPAGEHLVTIHR